MLIGIVCLVLVGSSWALIGVIMGQAPKRGIDTGVILIFGALVPFTVSATLFITGIAPTFSTSLRTGLIVGGIYALSGMLNFILLQLMAQAMQRGPNGIIWAIIQSGVIFPFAMGMIFFAVPATPIRLLGIIALLLALALFAFSKDNARADSGGWLTLSLIAFLVCGAQQVCNNLPSYIPEVRDGVSYYYRTFSLACGGIISFSLWNLLLKSASPLRMRFLAAVRNPLFWKYVLVIQGFGLLSAYFLLYRGMDLLSKAGIGSASYPLLIGSCIVVFTIYSRWVLKERHRIVQWFGLLLCVSGIVMICFT